MLSQLEHEKPETPSEVSWYTYALEEVMERYGLSWQQARMLLDAVTRECSTLQGGSSRKIDAEAIMPTVVERQVSTDGSRKYLVEFADGVRAEAVGIPWEHGGLGACISSQAGCPMGCVFCSSGAHGLTRNLTASEIASQLLVIGADFGKLVTTATVMGMGEPFANFDEIAAAAHLLRDEEILGLPRKLRISTCGIPSGIDRFAAEDVPAYLAVSLHAARQELRDELMPGVAAHPLTELKSAIARYLRVRPQNPSPQAQPQVVLAYMLIAGVNDSKEDLDALIEFCGGIEVFVSLISYNEVLGQSYKHASDSVVQTWLDALGKAGIDARLRPMRGNDIDAACGQLYNTNAAG